VVVGIALISGYILLGATYLIIKTTGPVQERAYRQAFWSAWAVLGFQILITIWTPLHYPMALRNWLYSPRIYFIWAFPLLGLLAFYWLIQGLRDRREILPFYCSVVFYLAGYLGLIASIYPYAIPPNVTFHEAAAQPETLQFTLWGALIVLPLVLGYMIYSYTVFRGKVGGQGYYETKG
jgi:cytochrome d ubiquinol oxidase subunit II